MSSARVTRHSPPGGEFDLDREEMEKVTAAIHKAAAEDPKSPEEFQALVAKFAKELGVKKPLVFQEAEDEEEMERMVALLDAEDKANSERKH